MRDVNKIILIGRLGADPVQRETKKGMAVVHFPLATSRRTQGEEGAEPGEETQWHRIVVWGKQGEHCTQFLRKGLSAYVEGEVRTRKYLSKTGDEKFTFEVHAERVNFLGVMKKPEVLGAALPMAAAEAGV